MVLQYPMAPFTRCSNFYLGVLYCANKQKTNINKLNDVHPFIICLQTQENQLRQSRGDPPLPDDDINRMFKPPQPPPRLDSLLLSQQINCYVEQITEFATQSFGKLFMADSLQVGSVDAKCIDSKGYICR